MQRAALEALARQLERVNPNAAASLREGLNETLTVTRLGVTAALLKTVMSTNPVESMIEIVRAHARIVKHWQPGDTRLRWAAAGRLVRSTQFSRQGPPTTPQTHPRTPTRHRRARTIRRSCHSMNI
jgi:putative transposase